jgi:hypothetical protein
MFSTCHSPVAAPASLELIVQLIGSIHTINGLLNKQELHYEQLTQLQHTPVSRSYDCCCVNVEM